MIGSSNSLSRGSGMPYQVDDAILHAMSGIELSRVRTELRLLPPEAYQQKSDRVERGRHCYAINWFWQISLLQRSSGHVDCTARLSMVPMPRRPHHLAAACTDATAHPRRGHHKTTSYTSRSVRSPGRSRPHRQVRRPGTTAPSPRSHLPFLPSTRHTPSPFYSR
jgi:hypothetical protein